MAISTDEWKKRNTGTRKSLDAREWKKYKKQYTWLAVKNVIVIGFIERL